MKHKIAILKQQIAFSKQQITVSKQQIAASKQQIAVLNYRLSVSLGSINFVYYMNSLFLINVVNIILKLRKGVSLLIKYNKIKKRTFDEVLKNK